MLFRSPFQEAIHDFHRAAPSGSKPRIIRAGFQEFSMYRRWRDEHPAPPAWPPGSDDEPSGGESIRGVRYHGLAVELVARNARISVAGETPDGKAFEYPPS